MDSGWTRAFHTAMQPWTLKAVYVNSLDQDEAARVPEAYGANYARLESTRRRIDPSHYFNFPQAIGR